MLTGYSEARTPVIASWPGAWVASRKSALAAMSPTPEATISGSADPGRAQRPAAHRRRGRATSATDAARAATSGVSRESADGLVEQHEEAGRTALPASSAGSSAAGRARAQGAEPVLRGDEGDGHEGQQDADGRPDADAVPGGDADEDRDGGGGDRRRRGDDAHHPAGQGAEEDHQPRRAGQAGGRAPRQVGGGDRAAEPGQEQQQRGQPRGLRQRHDARTPRPAGWPARRGSPTAP